MASPTIPFSNPAGKNQTNPSPIAAPVTGMKPMQIPGGPQPIAQPVSKMNPYVPPATGTPTGVGTSGDNGFITNNSSYSSGQNDLSKQLTDIYGKGVGGSLFSLLNSMSGTDSQILQEYIQSLQPQMKTAQANINAALGAGGVSANSSVSAIADSNLQAQEFSSIASESANLTKSQEDLTAQILSGMEGASAKEVATSGWSIFGDVMNQITGDIGNLVGGSYTTKGNTPTIPSNSPIGQAGSAASGLQATDPSLYNPPPIAAEDVSASLAAFA